MLLLFEKIGNNDFKPVKPLRGLSSNALSILHERGFVRLAERKELEAVKYDPKDVQDFLTHNIIEYRAVYSHTGQLAGAYVV